MLQSIEYIVGATTLREAHVAVHSYSHYGAVHISLVGYEHFAEVVGLACLLQDFALEVAEGRVSPARTTAILVLDAVATKAIKAATIIVFFMNSFLFILMFLLYLLSDSFF